MEEAKRLAMQAHQLHQLKKEAIAYYQENGAPQKMEESLNLMFKEKPDCVFGYLSNFFTELAKEPVISSVQGQVGYDNRGVETVIAKVSCRFKNCESVYGSAETVAHQLVFDHDKQEAKDKEAEEQSQHVLSGIAAINEGIFKELSDRAFNPCAQRQIDKFLAEKLAAEEQRLKEQYEQEAAEDNEAEKAAEAPPPAKAKESSASAKKRGGKGKEIVIIPDEPREGFIPGSLAVSALSLACSSAGAKASQLPLYEHLRRQFDPDNSSWCLPLPMVTILSGSKTSAGKSNCIKEYMLVPKPSLGYAEVLKCATKVYQHVAKSLAVKGGPSVRLTNDLGALNAMIDRPEAGFDLINEALRSLELTESFQLAINVAGQELFDYEKGKYDLVQGTQKTADELADFFHDILNKQPSIVAIFDPMRRVEKEAWMRLCHKVSERCLVVGDFAHHRPGLLLEEELSEDFRTSGWTARLEQRSTVTELFDCAKKMREAGNEVIAAVGPSDTSSSAIIDIAVAVGARFVKIGAPLRSEKINKFTRLVEIGDELQNRQLLSQWEDLVPNSLLPPAPESAEAEAGQGEEQEKAATVSSARSRKSPSSKH